MHLESTDTADLTQGGDRAAGAAAQSQSSDEEMPLHTRGAPAAVVWRQGTPSANGYGGRQGEATREEEGGQDDDSEAVCECGSVRVCV